MNEDEKTFRQCAAVFLVREGSDPLQFLLVHKPRKNDAWQLPQGGIERGETSVEAAERELKEEVNAQTSTMLKTTIIYEYTFPANSTSSLKGRYCGQQVYFHAAMCCNCQHLQVDNEEIDEYKWVTLAELPQYIEREEYRRVIEQLHSEVEESHFERL